ncbi:MAG: right-handed parallel beta-helix repeat-containing protein, partial [Rhodothermales bacterium]
MQYTSFSLFLRPSYLILSLIAGFMLVPAAFGQAAMQHSGDDSAGQASTYYVSPQGKDSNTGTQAQPWKTMLHAVTQVAAGDLVLVADGIYEGPVIITRSGTPGAYITFKSINKWGAKIEVLNGVGNEDGIKAAGNYLTIDGFEMYDVAPGVGHLGNGITVYNNHHVNIKNNRVHNFGGSGIQAAHFDHVLIENNVVFNNANFNPNQSSGISLYQARAVDSAPGYHAIVRNNRSYGNMNVVTTNTGITRDGNGILIDDFWNSTGDELNVIFPHRTLIENNLCYDNGGKGIQVFKSNHVDIFNNTAYHNNHDTQNTGTWRAELSLAYGDDTVWRNNIGVSNPGAGILSWNRGILIARGGVTEWENNLTYNGSAGEITINIDGGSVTETYMRNNNQLGVNPLFQNAGNQNFSLTVGSPAVNAGSDDIVTFLDINYLIRPQDAVDIGAFEFDGVPLPVELTSFNAVVSGKDVLLSWTTASELNNAGFAVELGTPDRDFAQVLFVDGQGTTD